MSTIEAAIVLCAGRGKRLKPYTDTTPKPLLPVDGIPTLSYILESLSLAGIQRVCLVTHYLGEQIAQFAADQAWYAQENIACVQQESLAGTADAAMSALNAKPDWYSTPFLITASDYIVPAEFYQTIVQTYEREQRSIVVSTKYLGSDALALRSSIRFDDNGNILEVVEKPAPGTAPSQFSANLVYILPPDITPLIRGIEPSKRGEKEIQSAVNLYIKMNGVASATEQAAPMEWQPPMGDS